MQRGVKTDWLMSDANVGINRITEARHKYLLGINHRAIERQDLQVSGTV